MFQPLKNRIAPFSFFDDLKRYNRKSLFSDISAGLAVALFSAPQSMADSLVAGLPPTMGIATLLIATWIIAILSSSPFLSAGPTNSIAILISGVVTKAILLDHSQFDNPDPIAFVVKMAIALTLMVGILQFLAGFFQFGQLVYFIGRPVILGYMLGVVINVFASQIINFLGIPPLTEVAPLYAKIWYFITHLTELHIPTTLIGVGCLFCYFFMSSIMHKPNFAALAILFFSGSMVYLYENLPQNLLETLGFNVPIKIATVNKFNTLDNLIPHFSIPHFSFEDSKIIFDTLFPMACTIALFGALESSLITRLLAAKSGSDVNINQDIVALGIGNTIAAFFGGMPCSGSTSRSTLNYAAGAQTRLAIIFSSLFVLGIVLLLTPLIAYIPLTGLAALLFFTLTRMVSFRELRRCLFVTRSDTTVLILTVVSSIFLGLDVAFYLGFAVSIMFYLRQAARPKFSIYGLNYPDELPHFIPSLETNAQFYSINLIHVEGELFFGSADILNTTLRQLTSHFRAKVIILNVQNARDLDVTSCQVLEYYVEHMRATGRHLIFCGVRNYFYQVLQNYQLLSQIEPEHLFRMDKTRPPQSLQDALKKAKELVQPISLTQD